MKTNIAIQFRLLTATAVFALAAVSTAVAVADVPTDHMGPGAGSVKSAPFIHVNTASGPASTDAMSFHVDANGSTNTLTMGPGQLSVKAPGIH
jgi:hypothetical protein